MFDGTGQDMQEMNDVCKSDDQHTTDVCRSVRQLMKIVNAIATTMLNGNDGKGTVFSMCSAVSAC